MSATPSVRTVLFTAAGLCLIALAGCSSGDKTTQTRGLYVTDATIAMLKASNTDEEWIFLLYGTPGTKKHDDATGHDTWSWDFYKAERRQGIQQSSKVYERTMYAEFDTTGTLVRAWATSADESMYE